MAGSGNGAAQVGRRVLAGAVLCTAILAVGGCSSSAPPAAGDGAAAAAANAAAVGASGSVDWQDWAYLDWRLDRPQLISVYLFKNFQPADPLGEYVESTRWTAARDSVGLDVFLGLDPGERAERRKTARKHRDRALRLARVADEVWAANREGLWLPVGAMFPPPPGAGDALTKALGDLITACGLDPSAASIWYDLAFLAAAVGDDRRAEAAISAGLVALEQARTEGTGAATATAAAVAPPPRDFWHPNRASGDPGDPAGSLHVRLLLDRAWLRRDTGRFAATLADLARADSLLAAGRGRTAWTTREAVLVRALIAAETGDLGQAQRLAGVIGRVPVWVRNREAWRVVRPEGTNAATMDKGAWQLRRSPLIGDWIVARAHLALGQLEQARATLGDPDPMVELPPGWDRRYWNDVGQIHAACGRSAEARLSFALAAVRSPYFIYYPMIGARGSARVGDRPGSGGTYFLAYRHFYLAGDFYSYAANTAVGYEVETDPLRRRLLAATADDALTVCRRRGLHPASALALRGRLRFFEAHYDSALVDLETAYSELREQGAEDGRTALLIGLILFNRGDYHDSEPWLARAVELLPDEAFAWRSLGLARIFGGDADEALVTLDRAVALDGSSHYGWYNRGLLYLSRGDLEPARRDLLRAAELAPDDADVIRLTNLVANQDVRSVTLQASPIEVRTVGEDLGGRGPRQEPGISLADELAGVDPEGNDAWLTLLGTDPEQLVAELETSHHAQKTALSRRNLAWVYLRTGRARDARNLLLSEGSKELAAEDLRLVLEADRQLGQDARARRMVADLATDPDPVPDARVWAIVAAICLDHGWNDLAREALDLAIALDPGNMALLGQRAAIGAGATGSGAADRGDSP